MTVKEKLIDMLYNMGLFEDQATKIVDLAIPIINESGYKIKFNDPSNSYPDSLYIVLMIRIKPIALDWIDQNASQAWYRSMFV